MEKIITQIAENFIKKISESSCQVFVGNFFENANSELTVV